MLRISSKSGFALALAGALAAAATCGCGKSLEPLPRPDPLQQLASAHTTPLAGCAPSGVFRGLDRNDYLGDSAMRSLYGTFAFTGYWLTPPPGARSNSWIGKRDTLRQQGWGFLILANGRFDKEILKAQKAGTTPAQLGRQDAAVAVAAAKSEGFPQHAIVFLDQEEGGRLLDEQAEYLLAWTEAVAASDYKPGVYASGQLVPDGPGKTIDTVQHIRSLVKEQRLHQVAIYDYQDACPPAPGCTLDSKPLSEAGEPDLIAWQYAQSPSRPEITKACAKTYAANGNCYAPAFPSLTIDLDAAATADPSSGR
jgi:hypothetical protein